MEEHGNDLVFCFLFHRDKVLKRCRLLCFVEEHGNDFVFLFPFLVHSEKVLKLCMLSLHCWCLEHRNIDTCCGGGCLETFVVVSHCGMLHLMLLH